MSTSNASYSTLRLAALQTLLDEKYGMTSASLTFLKRGFNDTYLVNTSGDRYILRVYRTGRRSLEEIRSEVKVLLFLGKQNIFVSIPLADANDVFVQPLPSAEGMRYAVLFSFVEGEAIRKPTIDQCHLAGEAIAKIHHSLSSFEPGPMTWNYQPDAVFRFVRASVDSVLAAFPDDLLWLDSLEESFRKRLSGIVLRNGICHGDLQPENFHFLPGSNVSFIDFDFSGYGPLLFDLGAYTWYDHRGKSREMLQAFYKGYGSVIPLSDQETALIPWFGALRALFLMGMWNAFMDGDANPVWPADQIHAFIGKLKKWMKEECGA
jgi:Ser/Thr protein kinase RdoA (MazF antagonist)